MVAPRSGDDGPVTRSEPDHQEAAQAVAVDQVATVRRRLFYALCTVLTVALVTGVAVTVLMLRETEAEAKTDMSERNDVMRVAQAFVVNFNEYSWQEADSYRDQIKPYVTDRFLRAFNQDIEAVLQLMRAGKMRSTAELLSRGVASIGEDSAAVLVVADADVSTVADKRQRHFRWRIDLVREGDTWLVDGFEAPQ